MNPQFIAKLKIEDMVKMVPGIILQSIGFAYFITSIKYGKVTITSAIQKAKVVVTFLLGVIILKENFTILQIIVSILLVVLTILVANNKNNREENTNKKAEQKAVLFSFGFIIFNGLSNFMNKIYVTKFQDPLYVVFNYAIIIIVGVLLYCIITKQWSYIDIRKINNKKYFILQAILDSSSSIFDRFSLLNGDLSVTTVISTSSNVITILASRWILKEKVERKKYIMIVGIFICVLLLAIIKE